MNIYCITNLINNKKYIGQTIRDVNLRFIEHCKPTRVSVSALSSAINKYGKENFKIEILFETNNKPELLEKERYYIEFFSTLSPNGYNLTTGGESPEFTEDELKKRKERRKFQAAPIPKGYKQTPEWVEKRVNKRRKPVKGVEIKTGSVIILNGATEIKNAGFNPSAIYAAANGRLKTAYGYKWEFINKRYL